MAANKDKTRAAAQKYLQKGQIDKAIREYQRLVEADPKDVRTLLKIGDLQTRSGDHERASQTYGRVAQFYSDQGFFLKAVAVYKQILRLDSDVVEVNLKLADLYYQLGLMSDAANQYRQVSVIFEQQGRLDESIEILTKMVELDPDNVAGRIKLAESYANQGETDRAKVHFQAAADYLKAHHRIDDYVKVAERVIYFDPSDLETTRELADLYIQKNDPRRALAKLQVCFKADSKDIETLNLLAAAFKELGQTVKTLSVYRELGRLYAANGDRDAEHGIMRKILALEPDDAEAKQTLESSNALPDNALGRIRPTRRIVPRSSGIKEVNRSTEDLSPPKSTASVPPPPPQPASEKEGIRLDVDVAAEEDPEESAQLEDAISRILIEADVYIKYGLKTKAIEHIRKVFELRSNHREARVRYRELLVDTGELDAAVGELMLTARQAADTGDLETAAADLRELLGFDPSHEQARTLLEKVSPSDEGLATGEFAAVPKAESRSPAGEPSLSYEPSPAAAKIDLDDDAEDERIEDLLNLPSDPETTDRSTDGAIEESDPASSNDDIPELDDDEFDDDTLSNLDDEDDFFRDEPAPLVASSVAKPLETEVSSGDSEVHFESKDDYLEAKPAIQKSASGEGEVAFEPAREAATESGLDDLDALLAGAVPSKRPHADAAPTAPDAEGEEVEPGPVAEPQPDFLSESEAGSEFLNEPETLDDSAATDLGSDDDEIDLTDEVEEIQFFIEQGLEDEATEQLAALIAIYGERKDLLSLQKELAPNQASVDTRATGPLDAIDESNLTQEIAEDLDAFASDDDFQVAFQDVFDEFKRGVANAVEEGDFQTHYDLGIAYKEMGLYADAIREFETAARSNEKAIGALTMMGLCALSTGDSSQALSHFLRGLNSEYVTPDEALALRFEIGQAYEQMERPQEAIKFFEKVESIDPEFRGVSDRLSNIRAGLKKSDEGLQAIDGELDQLLMETDAERSAQDKKISYI